MSLTRLLIAYLPLATDGRSIHFKTFDLDENGTPTPVGTEQILMLPGGVTVYTIYTAPSIVWDSTHSQLLVYFCGKKGDVRSLTWSLFQLTVDNTYDIKDLTEIASSDANAAQALVGNARSTPSAVFISENTNRPYIVAGSVSTTGDQQRALSMFAPSSSNSTNWQSWTINSSGQPDSNTFIGSTGAAYDMTISPCVYLAGCDTAKGYIYVASCNKSDLSDTDQQGDTYWPTILATDSYPAAPIITPLLIDLSPPMLWLAFQGALQTTTMFSLRVQATDEAEPGQIVSGSLVQHTFGHPELLVGDMNSYQLYGSSVAAIALGKTIYLAYMGLNKAMPDYFNHTMLVRFDLDDTDTFIENSWQSQVVQTLAMKPAMCFIPKNW